jgi:hypothetical protein
MKKGERMILTHSHSQEMAVLQSPERGRSNHSHGLEETLIGLVVNTGDATGRRVQQGQVGRQGVKAGTTLSKLRLLSPNLALKKVGLLSQRLGLGLAVGVGVLGLLMLEAGGHHLLVEGVLLSLEIRQFGSLGLDVGGNLADLFSELIDRLHLSVETSQSSRNGHDGPVVKWKLGSPTVEIRL